MSINDEQKQIKVIIDTRENARIGMRYPSNKDLDVSDDYILSCDKVLDVISLNESNLISKNLDDKLWKIRDDYNYNYSIVPPIYRHVLSAKRSEDFGNQPEENVRQKQGNNHP